MFLYKDRNSALEKNPISVMEKFILTVFPVNIEVFGPCSR